MDDRPLVAAATSSTRIHAAERITLVRTDHFVREMRTTTVTGKNTIAASTTSHFGARADVLGGVLAINQGNTDVVFGRRWLGEQTFECFESRDDFAQLVASILIHEVGSN